ncbi:MAG TPA: serine--tRNA synthetase [Candidatus Binatia bacterium]|nr:serine--tRNA synthetase [Candidatus Binatia bacterium]
MLDVKLLREDLPRVKKRMATRGTEVNWDQWMDLDQLRRNTLASLERLKERKKPFRRNWWAKNPVAMRLL